MDCSPTIANGLSIGYLEYPVATGLVWLVFIYACQLEIHDTNVALPIESQLTIKVDVIVGSFGLSGGAVLIRNCGPVIQTVHG